MYREAAAASRDICLFQNMQKYGDPLKLIKKLDT